MHLGDHYQVLARRLGEAGFEPGDVATIVTNYALGLGLMLDIGLCPRGCAALERTEDLISTVKDLIVHYECPSCRLELTRFERKSSWLRLLEWARVRWAQFR
jgi:hypothetical protein